MKEKTGVIKYGRDHGFLVVLLIAVVAIWPFISRSSLPVETDAELHIFRLFELGQLIRGGEIYPRWAPHFYHGFGYPIFNYYAPLTYYLGLPVELLPPFDAVDGVKFVFVLGMLAGGIGLYGFVRDNWGRFAGYVAAAVYLYAPYVQYIDPHARGVLAESFSLGVFPLALWALDRVRRGGGGRAAVTAVFLTAAVILSHNLMALLFFGLLAAWAVWHSFAARRIQWHLFLLLGLGLAVAAFFWLPVYGERDAVNLNTLLGEGDNYDFRTHFLNPGELFSFSPRLDWGASQPDFRFNLGVGQWLLAGLGFWALLRNDLRQRAQLGFFALGTMFMVLMMLPLSTVIWEQVPFLPFFQFPWRLLGPSAILMAIVAGAGIDTLRPVVGGRFVYVVTAAVLLPILLGIPLSQPPPWGEFGDVNMLRLTLIENSGRWLGTTSTSDYVPATVDMLPRRENSVVAAVAEGGAFDRINWAVVPEGTTIETERVRPLFTRYHVEASRDFRLRLFQFDFPGWEVSVNGEPVAKELGRPEGFIVVPLSAGEQVVDVRFESTPVRRTAVAITWAGLLLTGAVGLFWRPATGRENDHLEGLEVGSARWEWPLIAAVALVTILFALVLNPLGWPRLESRGFTALPAQEAVYADFGEQIALIGYTAPVRTAAPGERVPLTLFWKAQDELAINYQVFVHVQAADGFVVAQSDKINPGDFPTRRWSMRYYVRDEHWLLLPPGIAPGEYTISTGLWVQDEGWRLPLLDEELTQIGDNQELFTLVVTE